MCTEMKIQNKDVEITVEKGERSMDNRRDKGSKRTKKGQENAQQSKVTCTQFNGS